MLNNEREMYLVWLVIQELPEDEKKLIPLRLMNEIEKNMEKDENIKLDYEKPLKEQIADERAYKMLKRVTNAINYAKKQIESINIEEETNKIEENDDKKERFQESFSENEIREFYLRAKAENKLQEKIEEFNHSMKKGSQKFGEAKDLLLDYKSNFDKIMKEKESLRQENEKLKANGEILMNTLNSIPKFFRAIFLKDDKVKLLLEKN